MDTLYLKYTSCKKLQQSYGTLHKAATRVVLNEETGLSVNRSCRFPAKRHRSLHLRYHLYFHWGCYSVPLVPLSQPRLRPLTLAADEATAALHTCHLRFRSAYRALSKQRPNSTLSAKLFLTSLFTSASTWFGMDFIVLHVRAEPVGVSWSTLRTTWWFLVDSSALILKRMSNTDRNISTLKLCGISAWPLPRRISALGVLVQISVLEGNVHDVQCVVTAKFQAGVFSCHLSLSPRWPITPVHTTASFLTCASTSPKRIVDSLAVTLRRALLIFSTSSGYSAQT